MNLRSFNCYPYAGLEVGAHAMFDRTNVFGLSLIVLPILLSVAMRPTAAAAPLETYNWASSDHVCETQDAMTVRSSKGFETWDWVDAPAEFMLTLRHCEDMSAEARLTANCPKFVRDKYQIISANLASPEMLEDPPWEGVAYLPDDALFPVAVEGYSSEFLLLHRDGGFTFQRAIGDGLLVTLQIIVARCLPRGGAEGKTPSR